MPGVKEKKIYTVPNQKVVEVQKEPTDKENTYAAINIEAMKLAMKDLTPAQFQVWLYFAKNQQGHVFAASPAAALNEFGISKDTFQRTVRDVFEKKGYLVNNPAKGANYFVFHEIPEDDIIFVEKA